ncbi:hypothetical protein NPIL_185961 [Nephila pilipes]|uniref:Uncharacterized protein n=1 Tax=Nephila pilipes TaxID=299642 RepID=A0A8X6TJF5_NEPPI|nr:hypothetical protein NPIL_185961 [Nephila pilipes]
MEMLNDSQNEMEFKDDSRFTISTISSISTSSIDTSSTCERKQKIESNIQVYTSVRQVTKRELAQNFSIHNDYEHPEYKSLKNSIRLFTKELKRLEDEINDVLDILCAVHKVKELPISECRINQFKIAIKSDPELNINDVLDLNMSRSPEASVP